MPYYLFANPETEETIELLFRMNEEKRYIDKNGIEWKRIFTVPRAAIDTNIDPESAQDFDQKMGSKRAATVGDLWEESKNLSEKRKKKYGKDKIKEKSLEEYKKIRHGKNPLKEDL